LRAESSNTESGKKSTQQIPRRRGPDGLFLVETFHIREQGYARLYQLITHSSEFEAGGRGRLPSRL